MYRMTTYKLPSPSFPDIIPEMKKGVRMKDEITFYTQKTEYRISEM